MSQARKIEAFRSASRGGAVRGMRSVHGHLATTVAIARRGFDFIYLDQQHGLVTTEGVAAVVACLEPYDVAVLVRVASQSPVAIGQALDAGAHGVIIPDIEDEEQAARAVAATRYPPAGRRSWGSFDMHGDGYAAGVLDGPHPLVFPMIESPTGVENVAEIAALDGVDGLYVGRFDLALTMGVGDDLIGKPGPHSDSIKVIRRACDHNGIPMATSGRQAALMEQGYRMLTLGSELDLILAGLDAVLAEEKASDGR